MVGVQCHSIGSVFRCNVGQIIHRFPFAFKTFVNCYGLFERFRKASFLHAEPEQKVGVAKLVRLLVGECHQSSFYQVPFVMFGVVGQPGGENVLQCGSMLICGFHP